MTQETWSSLSIFEQLSNIHGEIKRYIRAKNKVSPYADDYYNKVKSLIEMTTADPKNINRTKEILDEAGELARFRNGEVDADYILRYWSPYTDALTQELTNRDAL